MSLIPNAAMYRWTRDDHEQATADTPVLTPYEIPSLRLEKPKETTAGDRVPLALDQFMGIEAVARFDLGKDVFWEEIPPAAVGAKTLAELCAKLQETRSPRYPDAFTSSKAWTYRKGRIALVCCSSTGEIPTIGMRSSWLAGSRGRSSTGSTTR